MIKTDYKTELKNYVHLYSSTTIHNSLCHLKQIKHWCMILYYARTITHKHKVTQINDIYSFC